MELEFYPDFKEMVIFYSCRSVNNNNNNLSQNKTRS